MTKAKNNKEKKLGLVQGVRWTCQPTGSARGDFRTGCVPQGTPGPTFRQWKPHEGGDHAGDDLPLGITPSNSRPRVSNDNPYAESLFKTFKYHCNYQPKGFNDLDEARKWCKKFVHWYNNEHRHSGINFLTPAQRHSAIGQ